MTALLVSPDYISHYLPLSAVGAALRDEGYEVTFATGDGVRERVLADGFQHAELRLGAGSNATPETHGDDPSLTDFLAATREGMVATLELQARRRLHDLLWEPERVTQRLAEIVDDLRPALVLSDQLAFGASLAFRALDIPFTSFLPGHPCQLPPLGVPFGYPAHRPAGFAQQEAPAALHALCTRAGRAFTRRFNETLLELAPHARPVEDAFAEGAPQGTLVNYPGSLAGARVAPGATLVGPCVREEPGDPELDALEPGSEPRRAYVALGSFLSARSDVLLRIADALRAAGVEAVIASGVTPPGDLGPLPEGSDRPPAAAPGRGAACMRRRGLPRRKQHGHGGADGRPPGGGIAFLDRPVRRRGRPRRRRDRCRPRPEPRDPRRPRRGGAAGARARAARARGHSGASFGATLGDAGRAPAGSLG